MSALYLAYGLAATILIPVIVGVMAYERLHASLKFITWLLMIGAATETTMILLSLQSVNNLFAIHFYAVVEIIFLSLYFLKLIQSAVVRKLIVIAMVGLSCFAIIYAINGNNIAQFNSLPRAIECVYFSFLGCWLFFEMTGDQKPIDGSHYFIDGAILFYFSSCFLIFAFSKYQSSDESMIMLMYSMHSYINAICNLAYAVGLWLAFKRYYTQA